MGHLCSATTDTVRGYSESAFERTFRPLCQKSPGHDGDHTCTRSGSESGPEGGRIHRSVHVSWPNRDTPDDESDVVE